jgi:deoxyadenosine/deoxycytidine kinase
MPLLNFAPKTLIEIVGNVASGKTTLAKKLPQKTNLTYVDTDLFEDNPFLNPSVEDPKRWSFAEELYFFYLRAKKIPTVLQKLKKQAIVLDQGFHMPFYMYVYNRYRQKHITKIEWDFLHELFSYLYLQAPIPNIVVFLDIPINELLKRMEIRGKKNKREHELLYTKEYIKQLNTGLLGYVERMKQTRKCKSVIVYNYKNKTFTTFGKEQPKLIDVLKPLLS